MRDVYLEKYISSYSAFFASFAGFNSLIFAACVFLLLRHFKIVHDKDVPPIHGHRWIVATLVVASLSAVAAVLAEGRIASFYDDMFKLEASEGCSLEKPADAVVSQAAYYFQNCHRPAIGIFNKLVVGGSLLSFALLTTWFLVQVRRKT